MRLSRRSWHYKIYRYLRNFYEDGPIVPFYKTEGRVDYAPKSLCSYFWGATLGAAGLIPILALLATAVIAFFATAPVWYPIVRRRENKRKRGEYPKPIGDTLVVVRAKAFKSKHCPLVELV